jgi:hypothetical protein
MKLLPPPSICTQAKVGKTAITSLFTEKLASQRMLFAFNKHTFGSEVKECFALTSASISYFMKIIVHIKIVKYVETYQIERHRRHEIKLYAFLTFALDGDERSASSSSHVCCYISAGWKVHEVQSCSGVHSYRDLNNGSRVYDSSVYMQRD